MRHALKILVFILCLSAAQPGFSLDTAPHRQLVISVTDSWNDFHATVYRFERADGIWQRIGKGAPAVVGERGLAWDPAMSDRNPDQAVKREGDLRAPAGRFDLTGAMGLMPALPTDNTFPYYAIEPGTHCVDDPASHFYNRIVNEREVPGQAAELWNSSERMWQLSDLYRLLLVVNYNVRDPKPGNGSCIFMHIWRNKGQATTGCTAMAEPDLTEIVKWLKLEAHPELVQLPFDVYRQIWWKWHLPAPELLNAKGAAKKASLVDVRSVAPEVVVEMRYAGSDNFTGRKIYDCGRCFLRQKTAEKLARAALELQEKGLYLKVWDCYRPLSVQKLFWSLVPDPRFVADPKKGSRHNRGTAVDVTLVDAAGHELEMPTGFDDFSPHAAHGETHLSAKVLANRRLLAETMQKAGFRLLQSEWWHYEDAEAGEELLDVSFGELCR
jgi:D-alanyl-D-alanine dipeptidase